MTTITSGVCNRAPRVRIKIIVYLIHRELMSGANITKSQGLTLPKTWIDIGQSQRTADISYM